VAPKYRNRENLTETWAGRGLKQRWLTAAIKGGKKQDDSLLSGNFSEGVWQGTVIAKEKRLLGVLPT
jgi:H-NS histone family